MQAFRIVQSCLPDVKEAVQALYEGVQMPDLAQVLIFCSCAYDLDALEVEIRDRFAGIPVLGCTSAGSLGPAAYGEKPSLVAIGFSMGACRVSMAYAHDLAGFEAPQAQALVEQLHMGLERQPRLSGKTHAFAYQMIDGLSVREEVATRLLQGALGTIPLVGGSAGDDLHFERAQVFCNGQFRSDMVGIILVETNRPIQIFQTQHFVPGEERLVVTEAEETLRIVHEFNGLPAADEYARCLGVRVEDLDSRKFADRPVMVKIGSNYYVRSIQRVLPDGSLKFYCAIEEGVVLRVAHGGDIVRNWAEQFENIQDAVGEPALILGCDCVLRCVEVEREGRVDELLDLIRQHSMAGFCTFGEQYRGVHINQTLTGVAIGRLPEDAQ